MVAARSLSAAFSSVSAASDKTALLAIPHNVDVAAVQAVYQVDRGFVGFARTGLM